jgi:hypothetical protein
VVGTIFGFELTSAGMYHAPAKDLKMRGLLVLALLLAACASAPEQGCKPQLVALASITQLVPLDATDDLALTAELAKTIADARARVPDSVSPETARRLEDLETRYERLEAGLEGAEKEKERSRLLGAYYWDRLRVFAPDLAPEPPEEMLSAFERGTGRGD